MESPLSPILINRCLVFTFFALFNQLNSQINANISPPPPLPQPPATPPPLAPPPPSDGLRPVPPPESQSPAETPLNPAPLPHAQSLPNALSDQINKSPGKEIGDSAKPLSTHENKENTGKKIGLLFVGIAAIFQFGVVGFLAFKRRQLLQITDRYGTCSA